MIFVLSIIVAVFVALGGGWLALKTLEPESVLGWIIGSIGCFALGSVFGGLLGAGMFAGANVFMDKETVLVSESKTDLRAMETGSSIEGRFYLGSGYINSVKVLEYITEDSSGAIRVSNVPAGYSTLYERDGEKPAMRVLHYEEKNGWLAPFAVRSFENYVFTVPKGAVQSNYEVTAK